MSKEKIKFLLQATRPKTIPASVGPVLVGVGLSGIENLKDNFLIAFQILICAALLQIGANLANDFIDAEKGVDNSDRLGPMRVTSSGLVEANTVRNATIMVFLLASFVGVNLVRIGGIPILILGLICIFIAVAYTAGRRPLSHMAMGEFLAFIFFGPVAVSGTNYLLSGDFTLNSILIGFGPGFIALSLMAINNMRDRLSDMKSKKLTLAVLFGEGFSRKLPIFGIVGSAIVPVVTAFCLNSIFIITASLSWILFINNWRGVLYSPIDRKQNLNLAATGKYSLVYGVIFAICLLVSSSNH